MITIQSGMLMALGFLTAMLIGLLAGPAFWSRAVRLTTRRLKETMPLTETEIVADRDRIRAEYAIKMHKLESLVEQVKLAGARQQIEINRRDARVNMLEADLERLKAVYEEAQNARRVLEQTIADRLPRVEHRLVDAKKLIFAREREVGELTRTAERHARQLAEASAINVQQESEIERLSTSLSRAGRASQGKTGSGEALRTELEALRAKTREQAQLLARMQSLAGSPSIQPASSSVRGPGSALQEPAAAASASGETRMGELSLQVRQLRANNDDQAGEIARLKAAISVFESETAGDGKLSLRDSRVALKARSQSLEAQSAQQAETIGKLRAELAAANERLARQAAHYTGELRRLGTSAATASDRGRRASERASLAERVSRTQGGIGHAAADGSASKGQVMAAVEELANGTKASGLVSVGTNGIRANGSEPDQSAPADSHGVSEGEPGIGASGADPAVASPSPQGRPRLLDRLAGLSRTS